MLTLFVNALGAETLTFPYAFKQAGIIPMFVIVIVVNI